MRVEYGETSKDTIFIKTDIVEQGATILHLTDSHLLEVDDREEEQQLLESVRQKWREHENVDEMSSALHFRNILNHSNENNVDCTVMTGDIVDFPSSANLDFVKSSLQTLSSPYLYTLGNHDWYYPHLKWNDTTRQEYYPKFFDFTNGNPAYQVKHVKGIKLIAIDNSNYQITEEQLHFFEEQLSDGLPCLLFLHIPLYLPSLVTEVVRKWNAPILMAASGWTSESQKQWNVREAEDSTIRFYDLVIGQKHGHLLGIFCGHVHFSSKDEFRPNRYQYVTAPCFMGHYRIIRILPLHGND